MQDQRKTMARRVSADRPWDKRADAPFAVRALDSKYITIYITQTFNNIQNVPYVQD